MKKKHSTLITLLTGLSLLGILLGACGFLRSSDKTAPAEEEIAVDGLFWDLYILLGGVETFGKAISPLIWQDGLQCQYMLNALFCYDPAQSGVDAWSLAPVVRDGKLMPPVVLELPAQLGDKQVNGFTIHPDFVPLYEQLYGTIFTGQPLGEAYVNYEKERIEQYFENVIMARNLNDTQGSAYLLPAAYAVCSQHCEVPDTIELPIPVRRENTSPFGIFLGRIHGEDFGAPLTRAFYTSDGSVMQVFEGAVIVAPADQLDQAFLLPLADEMGMYRMEPVQQAFGTEREVFFYPITEKGFHVPILFDDFITAHGGRQVSGDPIAETAYYTEDVIRQCFENYCLDLGRGPEGPRADITPLGAWYLHRELEAGRISPEVLLSAWHTADALTIGMGEQAQKIDRKTPQVIIATVQDRTGAGVPDVGGTLLLYMPDGTEQVYDFPATDHQGIASLTLPLFGEKGSTFVMRYNLCLHLHSGEELCQTGAYLIND